MLRVWLCGCDGLAGEIFCRSLEEYGIQAECVENGFGEIFRKAEKETCDAVVMRVSTQDADRAINICRNFPVGRPQRAPLFFAVIALDDPILRDMLTQEGFCEVLVAPVSEYMIARKLYNRQQQRQQRLAVEQQTQRERCRTLLLRAGCPSHMRGFDCLLECLLLVMEKPDSVWQATKEIYPAAAERMDCSPSALERSIRTMLQSCPQNGIAALKEQAAIPDTRQQGDRVSITEFLTLAKMILERQLL